MVADVIKHIGADLPDLHKLLSIIKRELRSDESENQRDALFCFGMLAQHQPSLIQQQLQPCLHVRLSPVFLRASLF